MGYHDATFRLRKVQLPLIRDPGTAQIDHGNEIYRGFESARRQYDLIPEVFVCQKPRCAHGGAASLRSARRPRGRQSARRRADTTQERAVPRLAFLPELFPPRVLLG